MEDGICLKIVRPRLTEQLLGCSAHLVERSAIWDNEVMERRQWRGLKPKICPSYPGRHARHGVGEETYPLSGGEPLPMLAKQPDPLLAIRVR